MDKRHISKACSKEKRNAIRETRKATSLKRTSQVCRVYELKVVEKRLSKKQKNQLEMLFVEAKRFYNHILALRQDGIDIFKLKTKDIQKVQILDKDRNKLDYELQYLGSSEKQAILSRLGVNFKTCLSLLKSGKQSSFEFRFKSEYNSIPLKQYGITHRFSKKNQNKIAVQGIFRKLTVRGTKQIPFELNPDFANANLIKKPDGYYIYLTTFIDKEKLPKRNSNGKEIGIDFGCQDTLTFSDGQKVNVQIEESERMKKLQTKLNRHQTKRSNNRNKTINKIRREYQKITNKKKDIANQICSKLKNYDLVVIQDEQLKNWHKGKHGKKVQHSCMGTIKAKLQSYPNVVVLDRFIPTTKFCSKCGKKHDELKLWDRTFKCDCGVSQDRDVHAAQNMLDIFHLVDGYFIEHKLLLSSEKTLPLDRGKVKLAEFKTAVEGTKFQKTSQNDEARRCHVFSLA